MGCRFAVHTQSPSLKLAERSHTFGRLIGWRFEVAVGEPQLLICRQPKICLQIQPPYLVGQHARGAPRTIDPSETGSGVDLDIQICSPVSTVCLKTVTLYAVPWLGSVSLLTGHCVVPSMSDQQGHRKVYCLRHSRMSSRLEFSKTLPGYLGTSSLSLLSHVDFFLYSGRRFIALPEFARNAARCPLIRCVSQNPAFCSVHHDL